MSRRNDWAPDYSDPDMGSASDTSNLALVAFGLILFVLACLLVGGGLG